MRVCLVLVMFCTASTAASERTYTVKRNDTASGIARQFGVSVDDLARRNNLGSPDRLVIGQQLIIPSNTPAQVEYTVKRGDSLAGIAQQFGVSVSAIASHNGIRNPNRIAVGQTLLIPASSAGSPRQPTLEAETQRALDRGDVSPRWRKIVIHHSGSRLATPKSMDEYHRRGRRMENGLAYHFVIGNGVRTRDGEIYIGERWTRQLDGGHLASTALNRESIGICLIGDFNRTTPTAKQMESLHALVAYLMARAKIDAASVQTHRQANPKPTECPGTRFPTQQFLRDISR